MAQIREVSYSVSITAPAGRVWKKICEPCSILEWNPRIVGCESRKNDQDQIVRDYIVAPGGEGAPTMVETELRRSDPIMTITYYVEMDGLPIREYVAQILVTPSGEAECTVEIRSRFVDLDVGIDAGELVKDFYKEGLDRLSELTSGHQPRVTSMSGASSAFIPTT